MTETPRLDQLNLVAGDMEASLAFYRLLGVEVADTVAPWTSHHRNADVGLDLDFDSVSFAGQWNAGSPGTCVVLGFRFETRQQVDDAFSRLTAAGYRAQHEPCDAFWGARYAVVEDPDGNPVGLSSPRDPAMESEPPDPMHP